MPPKKWIEAQEPKIEDLFEKELVDLARQEITKLGVDVAATHAHVFKNKPSFLENQDRLDARLAKPILDDI